MRSVRIRKSADATLGETIAAFLRMNKIPDEAVAAVLFVTFEFADVLLKDGQ